MVSGKESSHNHKIRRQTDLGWPIGLALLVAAYCLGLRRYGFELADEGALLAHVDRVALGQIPYRDFHTGYGPGLYWLYGAAFGWWEASTLTVRTVLAGVHGLRALVLASLAGAVGGRGWAAGTVLVLVAFFLPVAPGVAAPGNVPYPAWFADALGLAALVLLVRRPGATVAVGALWGVVFAFKQNSGLLGLGAAALTVVLAAPPAPGGGGRVVGPALALAMPAAALALVWAHLDWGLALVLLTPLVPLAVAVARRPTAPATRRALVGLGAGFAVVAGAVVAAMMVRAGAGPVVADLMQVGTDTARTYHVPYPSAARVLAEAAAAPPLRAVRLSADAAWFALLPLVHLVAAVLVAADRLRSRLAVAVVVAAALGYLQLYPRMDFWHLLPLAPASLVTLVLVTRLLPARAGHAVLALLVLVALVRFAPTLPVLAAVARPAPAAAGGARLDVRWDLVRDERLRHLPAVVEAVRGRARVAGFPALGAVNFALGRPSPWRHDYFFPGRPGAEEERALAADVVRDPPDAVVVLDAASGPFAAAAAAHPGVLAALDAAMVEAGRIGPYRILVPRTAR